MATAICVEVKTIVPDPRISIVVPSYNQGRFLAQTLHSIFSQNYPDVEVLVLDGGSTDESVSVIRQYAPRLAYWRSHKDAGQAAAIAEGLRMATGEICTYLNSDDMLAGGSLRTLAEIFRRDPGVTWVIGDVCLIDERSRAYHYLREPYIRREWQICIRNCIPQPSVFWRRALYERCRGIDSTMKFCMDPDMFYQFWQLSEPVMVRQLLSYQRHHAATKTQTLKHVARQEYPLVLARYFQVSGHPLKTSTLLWSLHRIAVKILRLSYLHGTFVGLPRARRDLALLSQSN